jgi:hypothetical protein
LPCALARLHTRSDYGSLDLFGTFCGNAKKYIKKKCVCQRKLLECFKHSYVTFFSCPKKVTKEKAGRFNADHSLRLTLKLMNRPEQQFDNVRLKFNTLLRAIRSNGRRWFFR